MSNADAVKLFHMNRTMLDADLAAVESKHGVTIRPQSAPISTKDETFYPQFPEAIRASARAMAEHYEIFYCLENTLRDLVSEQLLATHGEKWWEAAVPSAVRENVAKNMQREIDAAVSSRSTEAIDYTTFGELSTIIDSNWDSFGDSFNSRKGLASVLSRLNLLRGPIAHCSALTEDEVLRLQLSLRDWFRQME